MAGYDYRQKLGQAYNGAAVMYKDIVAVMSGINNHGS